MQKPLPKLILCVLVCEVAGFIGSFFIAGAIPGWYAFLNKPSFNPPSWLFAPVWTILFLMMGVGLFLVWQSRSDEKRKEAIVMFFIQLALNAIWPVIFFGLHSPGISFSEIIILWFAIFGTIIAFYKISKTAAILLIPYIIWVSFAAILNYSIWLLN